MCFLICDPCDHDPYSGSLPKSNQFEFLLLSIYRYDINWIRSTTYLSYKSANTLTHTHSTHTDTHTYTHTNRTTKTKT